MNRVFTATLVCLFTAATVALAQLPQKEEYKELYQLFNRTDWRISNINSLVNVPQTNRQFKLLVMELEEFVKLLPIAKKNFVNDANKNEMPQLADKLELISNRMIALAKEEKLDAIKEQANDLFKTYTDFKLSLKKEPTVTGQ